MREAVIFQVFLVFASLISLANGGPLMVMSAPNLLRVGTAENIFVECQDCSGGDIVVNIRVMNHPEKAKKLGEKSVTLKGTNNFQGFGQIMIPSEHFSKDSTIKQFVYLQAHFPSQILEKIVLVSFQAGYIFIQTDKTLYTPDSKICYRMFGLTPQMEPVERNKEQQKEASIQIEFVTPEEITIPVDSVSLKSGIHSGEYKLDKMVSPGLWKLVAKFQSNPQQKFTAEFEVKEYVLPSFEVKLLPLTPFFYVDSDKLIVNIKATYLFGEEVQGTAFAVFGIMEKDEKRGLPNSLSRVPIMDGKGRVELKREQILETFKDITELVGSSIFVSVSVLTESGSEMVEAEFRGIQIVTSPYTISFKRTPKFFKPGMSFDVVVEVLNPDESPAQRVSVVVNPGNVRGATADNGMARLTINTEGSLKTLQITAKTEEPNIRNDRQASAEMQAKPYNTRSGHYIHISVDTSELSLGDNLKININLNQQPAVEKEITYLISSRGQLVKFDRYKNKNQNLISLMVPITKEMLPSFRITAYYHPTDNEVVSDSVWVDVKDSCMGTLILEPSRPAASYEPRKMFDLKITGDPGATVGLVAVDKGVYVLNNKHRLTQKKVWDVVEQYDTGCTPGGGQDNMHVFFDAGLLFQSNTASGTAYRLDLKCKTPARKKRASHIVEARTTLASQYKTELERDCCLDGMKPTPLSYTCERRSEYILDGEACVAAFRYCCKEMETLIEEKKEENLQLARSESDDSYTDSNEIVTRTNFPESWLWTDITLPDCPAQTPKCKSTTDEIKSPLQDTITTWQFTGISLSRTYGICVGEPLEVIVRKEFFIDLRLPYSAVRGEQLEIKAILHNYSPDPITVRIELKEEDYVCSAASKRRKFRQEVKVGPKTTRSVPYVIIPMKEGEHAVEVKASVKDSSLNDGIKKMLRVVPEGVLVKESKTVSLNPSKNGKDGVQEEILNSNVPKTGLVPNAPTSTQVSVTGQEQLSELVENAISGKSLGTLIRQPAGCGEQNVMHTTLPVIATTYLDKTKQWEAVGLQRRSEAIGHIKTGYQNQLNFRKTDGSFAAHLRRPTSTWLTAYVTKVFSLANNLISVKNEHICGGVKYLILNTQQPDGLFEEKGPVYHGEMTGGVAGKDSDASMTAFCLIAMQESRKLCDSIGSLPGSIEKAVAYLERRLPSLSNPYAVAMVSYALANEGKLKREILYRVVSPELSHWPVPGSRVFTLEATAYALLALVKVKAFEDARPVVRWFAKQGFVGGGFGSTQATIMVYQAVSEYWSAASEPEYNLDVDIVLPGRSKPVSYTINRDNHFETRTSKINEINEDVKVIANGTGEATIKMVSLYYALPKEKQSDCQKFDLSVEMKQDEKIYEYKLVINILYKDKNRDATMSILDIGLLTGFTVETKDLDLLSKGRSRTIDKYEMNTVLSERGSLIIYLEKVSHTRPEEISFRIHQTMKVGVLQPAAVSVYEYYDQTQCVKFYHPQREAGKLLQICRENECTCAEENCSMQKKGQISNDDRTTKICESTETSKIDYAYKVLVKKTEFEGSTDIYEVLIIDAIKEGNTDVGPKNKLRTFLSYKHCRESLSLTVDKTYLIMGSSKDTYVDGKTQTYQYILGERTWVEYWPSGTECQTDLFRPTCTGLEDMVEQYTRFACQQ